MTSRLRLQRLQVLCPAGFHSGDLRCEHGVLSLMIWAFGVPNFNPFFLKDHYEIRVSTFFSLKKRSDA